jgi:hypothetical protein
MDCETKRELFVEYQDVSLTFAVGEHFQGFFGRIS